MAKSLRSKWVRKCKKEKRVRYGKKELNSLLTLVQKANKNDVVVKDAIQVVRETAQKIQPTEPAGEDSMEMTSTTTTTTTTESVASVKALMNKRGAPPKWLHPRRLKKGKALKKKSPKVKTRKNKYLG